MSNHFSMGAINKTTNEYELVAINKELHCQRCNKWKCRCKQ